MRGRTFVLVAGSGAAVAAIGWWGASFLPVAPVTISKQTTYITEPLREDGTPDYALWLNRKYGAGVAPADNAAIPLIGSTLVNEPRDVLDAMGIDPAHPPAPLGLQPTGPTGYDTAFVEQLRRALRAPWTDAEVPIMAGWLEANRTPLQRLSEIVRARHRYYVPVERDFAIDTPVLSLLVHRSAAQALCARALRSVRLGEPDAAMRDCATAFRLGSLLDQGVSVVEGLVAGAMLEHAAETAIVLANPPAGRAQAAALAEELRRLPGRPPVESALEKEVVTGLAGYLDLYRAARRSEAAWQARVAAVAKMYREFVVGSRADSWHWSWQGVPRWAVDWDELLRTFVRCHRNPACDVEKMLAHSDLSKPTLLRLVALGAVAPSARRRLARALLSDDATWIVGGPLAGSDAVLRTWREGRALLRVARVSAAAAARRARDGRYPERAAALNAGADPLGFDPQAPSDGYAFQYSATAGGAGFSYTAEPVPTSGFARAFCADSTGRLAQKHDGTPTAVVDGLCDRSAPTRVSRDPNALSR